MRCAIAILFAAGLAADDRPPALRGAVIERDGGARGLLTVRASDHRVHCFTFDPATAVQRDGATVGVAQLKLGDVVDVVSDRRTNPAQPYARAVVVVAGEPETPPEPPARPSRRIRTRFPSEELFPRGNLTFAGAVSELNEDRLVLRTRAQGEIRIVLRQDTRYVCEGIEAPASQLSVNTRIFVRGSRNLEGDVEAYQVMWGRILSPSR